MRFTRSYLIGGRRFNIKCNHHLGTTDKMTGGGVQQRRINRCRPPDQPHERIAQPGERVKKRKFISSKRQGRACFARLHYRTTACHAVASAGHQYRRFTFDAWRPWLQRWLRVVPKRSSFLRVCVFIIEEQSLRCEVGLSALWNKGFLFRNFFDFQLELFATRCPISQNREG